MDSYTSNSIHYAVDINLGTTETNAKYYLYNGHIQLTSDGYIPTVSDTYEDLTHVSGTFSTDVLLKDGFDTCSQSIDITTGGDFSTLDGFNFNILNLDTDGQPYHKVEENIESYIVGSEVTFYVIIDSVWYKRWVGIVSNTSFVDFKYVFECDDKFLSSFAIYPKENIGNNNYPYANEDIKDQAIPICVGQVPYAKIYPVENRYDLMFPEPLPLVRIKWDYQIPTDNYVYYGNNYGRAGYLQKDIQYKIACDSLVAMCVVLPDGYNMYDLVGKYLYLTNNGDMINQEVSITDLKLYEIKTVAYGTFYGNRKLTYLFIERYPNGIVDWGNLYGNYTGIDSELDRVTNENLFVYVYSVLHRGIASSDTYTPVSLDTNEHIIQESSNMSLFNALGDFKCSDVVYDNEQYISLTSKTKAEEYIFPESVGIFYTAVDDIIFNEKREPKVSNIEYDNITHSCPFLTSGTVIEYDETNVYNLSSYIPPENRAYRFYSQDKLPNFVTQFNSSYFNYKKYDDITATPVFKPSAKTNNGSPVIQDFGCTVYSLMDSYLQGEFLSAPYGDRTTYPYVALTSIGYIAGINPSDSSRVNFYSTALPRSTELFTWTTDTQDVSERLGLTPFITSNVLQYRVPDSSNLPVYVDHSWQEGTFIDHSVDYKIEPLNKEIFPNFNSDVYKLVMQFDASNINNTIDDAPWVVYKLGLTGSINIDADNLYTRVTTNQTTLADCIEKICLDNGVVADVSKITNEYVSGRQLTEQKKASEHLQDLCNTSMTIGITSRDGKTKFKTIKPMIETSPMWIHDNDVIIDDSISNFSKTPLVKCFNELTVEYNYNPINNKFDGLLSINYVDAEEFPTVDYMIKETYPFTSSHVVSYALDDSLKTGKLLIKKYPTNALKTNRYITFTDSLNNVINGYIGSLTEQPFSLDTNYYSISFDVISYTGYDNTGYFSPLDPTVFKMGTDIMWRTYVQGINSYSDSKELWDIAHLAYLENKTINKSPDQYVKLYWAVDRNIYYNSEEYDRTSEWAYLYFKDLLYWITRQKYTVSYSIPLNSNNVKIEVGDTVRFYDAIITGDGFGLGYVTKTELVPDSNIINIELMFDIKFLRKNVFTTGDIIERMENTDFIIEDPSNTNYIIES